MEERQLGEELHHGEEIFLGEDQRLKEKTQSQRKQEAGMLSMAEDDYCNEEEEQHGLTSSTDEARDLAHRQGLTRAYERSVIMVVLMTEAWRSVMSWVRVEKHPCWNKEMKEQVKEMVPERITGPLFGSRGHGPPERKRDHE